MSDTLDELNAILESMKESMAFISDTETPDSVDKEAHLVMKALERPLSVITRKCKECGEDFQTDYHYKRYCSRACLKQALLKKGLEWNPEKSESERWRGEPPSTIYPKTLNVLRIWAQSIVDHKE